MALNRLIFALGIRHVGETNAKLLARHYGSIEALRSGVAAAAEGHEFEAYQELNAVEGIGDVVADAIVEFFSEPHNREVARPPAGRGHGRTDGGDAAPIPRSRARPWCSRGRWSR